jgi:uncharacterized protein involved in cysteine biosynthesis
MNGVRTLLRYSKLRNIAIFPLIVDLIIFGVVVYLICFLYLPTMVTGILAESGTGFWASILKAGAQTLAFVMGLIVSGIATFALGSWIASPFNSLLAEKSLVYFGAREESAFDTKKWLKTTLTMAAVGMIRSAILLLLGVALFVLSFVPVLHIPILFIGFFIISTDCLDYSLESLELNLRERFRYYSKHFMQISGFATGLGLTFLVPGLSFFLMPAAVVGAAHMAAENKAAKEKEATMSKA